jgi:hypothetical protein
MFTYPLSLNPGTFGGASVAKSYDLISIDNSKSLSRVAATSTTTPETLTISHQTSGTRLIAGQRVVASDRHLVRVDKTFNDPIHGEVQLSAYLVLSVPRGTTVVTLQEIKDQVGRLIALEQATGALDKLLNNEP